ncbi:hypothetical protein Leryth_005637 [Lithospermum erythrorhizon]|nr:hypothetical protein Leryth_005637 [Lithospermum erythrorhizon]
MLSLCSSSASAFPLTSFHTSDKYRASRFLNFATSTKKSVNCELINPMWTKKKKSVWIWTLNKDVMTAAVERGWNTFIFSPDQRPLAIEWASFEGGYKFVLDKA